MFKSGQPNPFDEIVVKATDENLTAENWELIITLCDKVVDEGETGARNVVAALLKRLAHRNPNVQLYALSLAESLSKNCGIELHRELASRSFTQAIEKIITDRTTHEKVKRRALGLISMWTADFEDNPSLGIMEECYNNLKAKNYKFDQPPEAPPPQVEDDLRRKEEEELQRVLEMSRHDKGGRTQWNEYSSSSSSGAGGSAAASSSNVPTSIPIQSEPVAHSLAHNRNQVPAVNTDSGVPSIHTISSPTVTAQSAAPMSPAAPTPAVATQPIASPATAASVSRVRALHSFQPTEPGELAFEKGDIIKVVDRNYKDWWRGQLRGRTGIFPVNYVEPLPEQTPAELAREAEQEAAIFAQAANIDKLLDMLRGLDPAKDNLADNEDIQELYKSSMSLRPKIVKLIDRYNQKKAELVSMNESYMKAKTIFERMMEESLARHTSEYGTYPSIRRNDSYSQQEFAAQRASAYGWPQTGYEQAQVPTPYGPPMHSQYAFQQTGESNGYIPNAGQGPYGLSAATQPPTVEAGYAQGHRPNFPQANHTQQPLGRFAPQPEPLAQIPQSPGGHQQAPGQSPQTAPALAAQPQSQLAPISQAQQQQGNPPFTSDNGPPWDFDPNGQYPDSGAQAWAQYYAQGGKDPVGAVYFKSVPGVTDQHTTPQAPNESSANLAPSMDIPSQNYGQAPYEEHAFHSKNEGFSSHVGMDHSLSSPSTAISPSTFQPPPTGQPHQSSGPYGTVSNQDMSKQFGEMSLHDVSSPQNRQTGPGAAAP